MLGDQMYGEYVELCGHLQKYMKTGDNILVAGCGSSALSADLYKVGFRQITNVDISELVIRQMSERYRESCPEMRWMAADLLQLPFSDGSFSCVLDKGTLDALMSDRVTEAQQKATEYFKELSRILRFGGRYVCISLLQEHILTSLLNFFPGEGWMMRFCRSDEAESSQLNSGHFSFPVFVVVCTKFKIIPGADQIIENNTLEGDIQRVDKEKMKDTIASLQHLSMLKHNLKTKLNFEEEVSLELFDSRSNSKRYDLFVVDAPKSSNRLPFAVFIVPHGRETEWLFRTLNGHKQLAETAGSNRLVVVHLMRHQTYAGMDDVQQELSAQILELAPSKLPNNYKIPFLSAGSDLGEREVVERGSSEFSGEFVVEDVRGGDGESGDVLRRLIFLDNPHLVQSEARLVSDLRKGQAARNKNKTDARNRQPAIDLSYLSCSHHSVMVAALAMARPDGNLLMVGLGGGSLANFIHKHFPRVKLTVVDIDPVIVSVAKKWFGFKEGPRMSCQIEDGVEFIKKKVEIGSKYDVVMFDIDSKDVTEGLSYPAQQFVERQFLASIAKTVTPKGIFVLNLACRDETLKNSIVSDTKSAFPSLLRVSIRDEVNVVLFGSLSKKQKFSREKMESDLTNLNSHLKPILKSDFLNSKLIMEHMKIL